MKLIFLDIDGVLNSVMGKDPYISDMEIEKLILLKKLSDETGAYIVITSDRRYSDIDNKNKLAAFSEYGIPVIGETRLPNEDDNDNRGKQILDYLSSSKEDIDRIVIFDDIDDGISNLLPDEFVKVNRFFGLNSEVYDKALQVLK